MVRETLRRLRRSPGYAALIVAILGLGIGASTAVYSVVASLLIQPLPYPDSDRLVRLVRMVEDPRTGASVNTDTELSVRLVPDLNAHLRGISDIAGYATTEMTVTGVDRPFRLGGAYVTPEIFPLLRARPVVGRTFGPDEQNVIVLSSRAWRSRFGERQDVLGEVVRLDGQVFTVVGVMAQGFGFPDANRDFWIPHPGAHPGGEFVDPEGLGRQVSPRVSIIARLAPGVHLDVAAAEATPVVSELYTPSTGYITRVRLVRLKDELVEPIRPALHLLPGAVACVLLIACVNVAGLGMARAASRRRESAIRLALGGGKHVVIVSDLAEFVTLGVAGGVVGVLLAYGAVHAFRASGVFDLRGMREITLESSAPGFALAVSVLSALAVSVAPAVSTWRRGVNALMQEEDGAASGGLRLFRRHRAHAVLVLAQIAMTTVLLVCAVLLMGSFVSLVRVDPGYDAKNLLAFQVHLPHRITKFPFPTTEGLVIQDFAVDQNTWRFPPRFAEEFLARLHAVPDIQSAGLIWPLPTSSEVPADGIHFRVVSPDALRTLGVELVEGRWLQSSDSADAPRVLLVNQAIVRRDYAGQSPVGTLRQAPRFEQEIVGVVADIIPSGRGAQVVPEAYVPLFQAWFSCRTCLPDTYLFQFQRYSSPHFVVRTLGQPASAIPVIRNILEEVEPLAALSLDIRTMEERLWASVTGPRFYAVSLGAFAAVALLLAAVGVYSVLTQAVADSTREIGIRMALGADRRRVLADVMRQAGIVTAIGLTLGFVASLAASRILEGMLFGVTPADPVMFLAAACLLVAVVTAAAWVPARRATRIDPMSALRHQ